MAQVLTSEDSLAAGLVAGNQKTVLSGYGEARMSYDLKQKDAEATLKRVVLFVGHKFSSKISLFTEMEMEDALVAGGVEGTTGGGEISMEQAFIKFDLNPSNYIVAGLFLPRMGIINENHLPTTFNGTDRPFVEQVIIPSTWRGLGVGFYGSTRSIPGLNYSLSLSNGLNSARFESGSGITEGRQQGANARGIGLSVNGSLLYYYKNFRIQYSTYMGGSTATEQRIADSLGLNTGMFANPVYLNEANVQYRHEGIEVKLLGCMIHIPNAANINRVYANNTPVSMMGAYAELGYNFLHERKNENYKALILFLRAEYLDLNSQIAENGIANDANKKTYLLAGLTFKPLRGVSVKMDYTHRMTGEQNPALIVTPFPQLVPYYTQKGFLNFGIAYNF
jgi:hypothetical protein